MVKKYIELFLGNKKTVAKLFGGIPVENHINTPFVLCQGAIFAPPLWLWAKVATSAQNPLAKRYKHYNRFFVTCQGAILRPRSE